MERGIDASAVFRHSLVYRLLHERYRDGGRFDIYFVPNRLDHASLQTILWKYDHLRML